MDYKFVHGDSDGEYEPPSIPKVLGLEGLIEIELAANLSRRN